jgi:queuine/archaeosine tRNA-ribosyltransferase
MGQDHGQTTPQKFDEKMDRKRYRLAATYGAYNREGLHAILEAETVRCPCPTCQNGNPEAIYDRFPGSEPGFKALGEALAEHRVYVTHSEMLELNSVIKRHKYGEHLKSKVESANEIGQILGSVSPH